MGEACEALGTPVTGGNVSLYNENPSGAVYPDARRSAWSASSTRSRTSRASTFRDDGDAIVLLGEPTDELGGERVSRAHPRRGGRRAAALRSRRASGADRRAARGDSAAASSARRTTAATAASPSRSPSAASWIATRQRSARRSICRHGATLPTRALLFGEAQGARRRLDRRCPTRCSRIAAAARRAGARRSARSRAPSAPFTDHDRRSRDQRAARRRSREAYHEAIPRIMSRARVARRTWRSTSRLAASELMCGIFGVRGQPDAVALAQARPVLAAASRTGVGRRRRRRRNGDARGVRSMGLVSDMSHSAARRRCTGSLAIGHTRYSTSGSSTIENAQPVARALARRPHHARAQRQPHQRRRAARASSRSRARSSPRRRTPRSSSTGSRARTRATPEERARRRAAAASRARTA